MKPEEIARRRVANQQLAGTAFRTGQQLVEWFAAVQGQEYAQTKWGLGLRLPNTTDENIEAELTEGRILRTHLLRPTWHFVSANDIRWLLRLTAPRVKLANGHMYRRLELDARTFSRCENIMVRMLQGNRHLTREELNEGFREHGIKADGHRLSYIMMDAELNGVVCSGVRRGKQFTYALLDERVPASGELDREEALTRLAERYFTSRGPATVHDFSTWSGLTMAECRKGLEAVRHLFDEVTVEGRPHWFPSNGRSYVNTKPVLSNTEGVLRRARSDRGVEAKAVYLLPDYDELLIGYKDRTALMQHQGSIVPKPQWAHYCAIMHDGQVIGTWKRTIKSRSIELFHDFFQRPTDEQWAGFRKCARRFGKFSGLEVVLMSPDPSASRRS